ncbi:MAG: competence protein ComK [Erysipelotrichales bacterium]
MVNIIYSFNKEVHIHSGDKEEIYRGQSYEYINELCMMEGTTLDGKIKASKSLLPGCNKLPIYIARLEDFLIPLGAPKSKDCIWISANNYLTCYEKDQKFYIKFIDKSVVEVIFSAFTIKKQYLKYRRLRKKIEEMRTKYDF